MSPFGIPSPVLPAYIAGNRFAPVNEDNHAGPIWISTLLSLVYSTLVLVIRARLKSNAFSLDDYIIFFSTFLQTGEVAALIVALRFGLGKSHLLLSVQDLTNANKATFAGIVLFIASTCFAKLSVIALMMRLFNLSGPRASTDSRSRTLWFTFLAISIIVFTWVIGSIVALSIHCSIPVFTSTEFCPAQALRWDVIGGIDMATEVLLVILSIIIVWPLHLNRSTRTSIVLAFAFRLPCAALSAIHIFYIHQYTTSDSTDPGLTIVPVLVIMQVQLCWSILSATVPNLKTFVRSFHGSFGHHLDLDSINASKSVEGSSASRSTSQESRKAINSTTLYAFVQPPVRPSRLNVDIEDIGWHAGIPAVPGLGAVRYVSRVDPGLGRTSILRNSGTLRNGMRRSARFEDITTDDHGVEARDENRDSREGIIQKGYEI